jgi:uncharacterized protein (UPF0218 family)
MADVLVELPTAMRAELKEPLGPLYTGADALLADAGEPLVAVGDVVTYHLLSAGYRPSVALVDGKTERETADEEVRDAADGFDVRIEVDNPQGTLTRELLVELTAAIARDRPTLLTVDGEEDLAALPAVAAAPDGAGVVYGQPDEGMVLVTGDPDLRAEVRDLLSRMDGHPERALAMLNGEP